MANKAPKHDPFKLLNFDCINIIFRYLTPIEVLQCSLVSRVFRAWAHSFIITDGLNHHFAHYADTGDFNSDSLSPVKRYAQFAQLQHAFKQGKPSSVLKFRCSDELNVRGNFAVWIYCSKWIRYHPLRTSPRERYRSEIEPIRKLKIPNIPPSKSFLPRSLVLNDEGYLLARGHLAPFFVYHRPDDPPVRKSDDSRDIMVQLEGPRFMWHHDYPDAREWPFCIGKERVYYLTTNDGPALLAYDIKTGHQLYRSALPNKIDLRLGSPVFQLLRDETDEIIAFQVLASLTELPIKRIIFVVNGSNGQTFQELDFEGPGLSHQHADTSTLILERHSIKLREPDCSVILFETFSRRSGGFFAKTSTNAFIISEDIRPNVNSLWIDTLRRLAFVIPLDSGEVKVLEIEEHPSPPDCYKEFDLDIEQADNWFTATERDRVSLPKTKGPNNLKNLVVQGPRENIECTACDDRRLIFQTVHDWDFYTSQTTYLLDFTPEPNHSNPGIYSA
ncbi:hypothetical protein FQN50_007495 [Emmonsiellopsis sp. PD_5]|nr:hypothetical protein FQN50_007495 [Emmonsiellopsis sp. PD_5]